MYDLPTLLRQFGPLIFHMSMSPTDGRNGAPAYQGNCRTRARAGYSVEFDDDPEQALAKAIVTAMEADGARIPGKLLAACSAVLAPPPKRLPAPPKPILPLYDNEDTAYEDLLGDDEEEDLLG